MLAARKVQIAEIKVKMTAQIAPFESLLSPTDMPIKPEPVARLPVSPVIRPHLHPAEQKQSSSQVSRDRPPSRTGHDMRGIGDTMHTGISHPELIHDVGVIFSQRHTLSSSTHKCGALPTPLGE